MNCYNAMTLKLFGKKHHYMKECLSAFLLILVNPKFRPTYSVGYKDLRFQLPGWNCCLDMAWGYLQGHMCHRSGPWFGNLNGDRLLKRWGLVREVRKLLAMSLEGTNAAVIEWVGSSQGRSLCSDATSCAWPLLHTDDKSACPSRDPAKETLPRVW